MEGGEFNPSFPKENNPILQSGYLNPKVPLPESPKVQPATQTINHQPSPMLGNPLQPTSQTNNQQPNPMLGNHLQPTGQTNNQQPNPMFAHPINLAANLSQPAIQATNHQMLPPTTGEVMMQSLQAANFDLQAKLEKANSRIKTLDSERKEMLDRLEKALTIAAKLKNVETERNDLMERLEKSESEQRRLFVENNRLKESLSEKSEIIKQIREKYMSERNRNEVMAGELEVVKSVSDLAKKQIDTELNRNTLRELQLSSMRSLVNTGNISSGPLSSSVLDDELQMAATVYDNSMKKTGATNPIYIPERSIPVTTLKEWQTTPIVPCGARISESARRLLLSGTGLISGTLFDDKIMSLQASISIGSLICGIEFIVTNQGPSIVSNIRLLKSNRDTSHYEFFVQPINQDFLKPGQSISVKAEFKLVGIYDSAALPTVCLSYTPSGSIPVNRYLTVPIPVLKFLSPVRPSVDQILTKWNEFKDNEVSIQFKIQRDELKNFSNVLSIGEIGGNLMSQRGIDPNPRGQVFAGALPAGSHGSVKEVITRIELSDVQGMSGPVMMRITVRSYSISLSKSIANTLIDVLM